MNKFYFDDNDKLVFSGVTYPLLDGFGPTPSQSWSYFASTTWTAPWDVYEVQVEAIGGGGTGGTQGSQPDRPGGGGGGGSYALRNAVEVIPGETYTVTVGGVGGNSQFIGEDKTCRAFGGSSTSNRFGGSGGQLDFAYADSGASGGDGGDGLDSANNGGGGGGGAGGSDGANGTASGGAGGAAGAYTHAGAGGDGGDNPFIGKIGKAYGGGGGGNSGGATGSPQPGYAGAIRITYTQS